MGDKSTIEWTDATWNVVVGCTRVSAGCAKCYAFSLHDMRHMAFMEGKKLPQQYAKPFKEVQIFPDRLDMPLKWKRPRKIFVNSLSDLFHEKVPIEFIEQVFEIMALAKHHTFQILTKRPKRMKEFFDKCNYNGHLLGNEPLPNVWLGVSVEDQKAADERIPSLLQTPAAIRFLSCEPLLGLVDLNHIQIDSAIVIDSLKGVRHVIEYKEHQFPHPKVDWIIVGGESGHGARPMHPEWARSLRDQCQAAGVSYFFKQWGEWAPIGEHNFMKHEMRMIGIDGVNYSEHKKEDIPCTTEFMLKVGKHKAGRMLDGLEWNEFPIVKNP